MIESERDVFTGLHLTDEVKEAAKEQARMNGLSLSRYMYEVLRTKLESLGYKFEMNP
jgi:hypothetical protein